MKTAALITTLSLFIACQKSETIAATSSSAPAAAEKTYTMNGKLVGRDAAKNTVTIDNEEVPGGVMPRMTMAYDLRGAKANALPADGTVITALSYGLAALAVRDIRWPRGERWKPSMIFIATGLVITVTIERWALESTHWRYAATMPTILGIGALPLLQWIVIPILTIAIVASSFRVAATGHRGS